MDIENILKKLNNISKYYRNQSYEICKKCSIFIENQYNYSYNKVKNISKKVQDKAYVYSTEFDSSTFKEDISYVSSETKKFLERNIKSIGDNLNDQFNYLKNILTF